MFRSVIPKRRKFWKRAAAETGLGTAVAVAGTANPFLAVALQTVGNDVLSGWLSGNERSRIERVLELASQEVARREALGHQARSDDFLVGEPGNRAFAEEVVEGVLRTVQQEHEEAKLPYYAAFMTNCNYDPNIDRASSVNIALLADALTFRQLCILALAKDRTLQSKLHYDTRLRVPGEVQASPDDESFWAVTFMQEVFDLEARHLVEVSRGLRNTPMMVTLTPLGKVICEALGLSRIEAALLDDLERKARTYNDD